MIHALLIINKAGGLIYNRDFSDGLAKLTSNEYLVLAGTFHGIHAIASRISPVPGSSGIELLEADTFKMYCFQTLTGVKFLVVTDPTHPNAEAVTKKFYEIYADFVMKNPFYSPEMPIRIDLFDNNIQKLARQLNGTEGR
ncbi:hypothetical protein HDU85_000668 [Gaertneriomyces sp. JEL0708]|nr:Sybindin-like protein [Gaertneriomyces semiglobifer]KAJ3190372.1 hypothetical protein HDU85_000668 [Gaertneriomyces sp. JEL0708]